ncbi:hypothetical protein B8V81_0495 [Paenibacillus pasadenensis]|uniref:Uncharacterized protein n=1 Tax=Paenibacillus pasadenensis TaxID=217090 RepID=A0A2N5NDF3_9BACL|nr:hypothetical protein B8V81_0495 [Paenibacillus pasadenensis]
MKLVRHAIIPSIRCVLHGTSIPFIAGSVQARPCSGEGRGKRKPRQRFAIRSGKTTIGRTLRPEPEPKRPDSATAAPDLIFL